MKKHLRATLLIIPLAGYSLSAAAFDVGGFVNGVIEGVSDSYKEARGKPGAHEKGDQQEQSKSTESEDAKQPASAAAEEK